MACDRNFIVFSTSLFRTLFFPGFHQVDQIIAPFELHQCRTMPNPAYPKLHQAVVHSINHSDNNQNYQDGDYRDTPQ